ncbi:class I SAM-dependent methyltransferase [Shewanella sp. OPT22]|nr:class I SAM-dependent methyltransferase [Shewanella sp. OPT22]
MNKYEVTVDTFNRLAKRYQDKYMNFDFYFDTYDRFLSLIKGDASILELGCGPGNITHYLLSNKPDLRILATDLAPNMLELTKLNNPSVRTMKLDGRSVEQVDETFDAIVCGFCTPYLSRTDIKKLIKDIRDKLELGGLLYLSTMEDDDNKSGMQTSASGDQVYIHYHQYEHIKAQLMLNNFKIIEHYRKQFPAEDELTATDLFIYARAI